ncbi:hypothetical protein N9948_01740 [bacterium]|nr:hypothetical protein [bacterium]
MESNDISFLFYFVPIALVICGVYACSRFYKKGYNKGVADSLVSCKHGGIHMWNKWKYFTDYGEFWNTENKRRFCDVCNDKEVKKV